MTAELVTPIVGQGYRAAILTCTLFYYCHSIVSTYMRNVHAVKYVRGRVGGDLKLHPK